MEYSIFITLDKDISKDYCILSSNAYEEEMVNLNIYTNGKEKIDFKKLNYLSFSERYYNDFITYFSYGRNIVDNAKIISITNTSKEEKNTKKDNKELMKLIKTNDLINRKLFIDVGSIELNNEDMDAIQPLAKCRNALVTYGETNYYHSIEELEIVRELIDDIMKRINKNDFSLLEKMLYAYDLIRTNYMINPEYEKRMEKILKMYQEPSYLYSFIYKEVLTKLKIKNIYSYGDFYQAKRRAINVAYVKDEVYDIEGVYYFDIGDNSKQRVTNSLMSLPGDSLRKELINNYESFCKTKNFMVFNGSLDVDYSFGDFDEEFMQIYDYTYEKEGANGVFKLRALLNNVASFVDGKPLIDAFKGIQSEDELDQIRNDTQRYVELFSRDIEGEDFLEILFNVRKVEYMENKEIFPLSIETFKECLSKSNFGFSKMNLEFDEEYEYEEEDIKEKLDESFEACFEDSIDKFNLEDRIRKLKLSLNKDINKPKKDDNN